MLASDQRINKRHWLIKNLDVILHECYYHRENSLYYSRPKVAIWRWGMKENCQKITDETSG